jgi:hypothetical protein
LAGLSHPRQERLLLVRADEVARGEPDEGEHRNEVRHSNVTRCSQMDILFE